MHGAGLRRNFNRRFIKADKILFSAFISNLTEEIFFHVAGGLGIKKDKFRHFIILAWFNFIHHDPEFVEWVIVCYNARMLHEQMQNKIKEAMLAKDQTALMTSRNISSAFTNELVAQGRKPTEILSDEEALTVIKRMAKKGKKAIELFKQGGRQDLVDKEMAEIKILETYLPKDGANEEKTNNA